MLYQSYKEKLEKRRRAFERVWRFRALFLLGLLLLLAAAGALLGVKGIVYGEVPPQDVEYGTPLTASAKAVFGGASFEFRPAGGDGWSRKQPKFAGKYECRAVAKSVFGTKRTGEVYSFEILPAKCEIKIENDSLVYGDEPQFSAELKYGDELRVNSFSAVRQGDKKVKITVDTDSVSVLSEEGEDATLSYEFEAHDKEVLDVLRSITVKTATSAFEYDGTPKSDSSVQITSPRKLIAGHKITVSTPSVTEVGAVRNAALSYAISDENGENVAPRYKITWVDGEISVLPRQITLETSSGEFTYDGEPHSAQGFSYADGSRKPIEGHELSIEYNQWINAAEYPNRPSDIEIKDASGGSVKRNYAVTVNPGFITINRRVVEVSAPAKSFEYNGGEQGFTAGDYTIVPPSGEGEYGLLSGHEFSVKTPFTAVDAAEYENEPEYLVGDAHGNDVTSNYHFVGDLGKLEITPRKVKFIFSDDNFIYDGKPHSPATYSSPEGFAPVEGHVLDATFAGRTDVGTYSGDLPVEYEIFSGKKAVTDNYTVEWTAGKVEIAAREISAATADGEWEYDGGTHSAAVVTPSDIAEGHNFTFTALNPPSRTEAGSQTNQFNFEWRVYDGANDVTANYTLPAENITYGRIEIVRRRFSLSTVSGSAEYDGEAHTWAAVTAENLAEGERLDFTVTSAAPSVTDAGKEENRFDFTYEIYGATANLTTQNYELSSPVEYGELEVFKRAVTVSVEGFETVYDGQSHTAPGCAASEGSFVGGHEITVEYSPVTSAGTYKDRQPLSWKITSGSADVSGNYEITFECGDIIIKRRQVTYLMDSRDFVYDGEFHSAPGCTLAEGSPALVGGHELSYEYDEWVNADEYVNEPSDIKVSVGGEDVTNNYIIVVNAGKVTISPLRITVTTNSDTWYYDGSERSVPGYTTSAEFVKGHKITPQYPKFKDVGDGEYSNEPFGDLNVYSPAGELVSDNYEIIWQYGTVKILPRPITVTTHDIGWVYDAKCHLSDDDVLEQFIDIEYYLGDSVGHTVLPNFTVMAKDAGFYADICGSVRIEDAFGAEVTENYLIDYQLQGSLNIEKRVVSFTTFDGTWVYDGAEHKNDSYSASQLSYFYDENGKFVSHGFYHSGFTVVKDITDTDTEAVYADNEVKDLVIREGGTSGPDRTANYIINKNWGKLRVKSPVVVYISTLSKPYDGEPLQFGEEDWFIEKKPPDTREEDVKINLVGSITTPGTISRNLLYNASKNRCTVANESVYRIDFTGNEISLEITKRELRITTASIVGVKDEEPLYGTDTLQPYRFSYGSLIEGHRLENFRVTGVLYPEEETAENTVSDFAIVDARGNPVTDYYNVTVELGTLSWSDE